MTDEKPKIRVNSVAKALDVLTHIAGAHEPKGVNAIARATNVSPSSCYNILQTLVACGFADVDPEKKTYSLGGASIDLAVMALDPETLFARLRPVLERMARAHGVTCGMWRVSESERLILIGAVESSEATRIRFIPGQRLPMLIGAMGRCVAAYSDFSEKQLRQRFNQLKWDNPPDFSEYMSDVREVKKNGYARDEGQFINGIFTVAAPIHNRDKKVTHCVAASRFVSQRNSANLRKIGQDVRRVAEEASQFLY